MSGKVRPRRARNGRRVWGGLLLVALAVLSGGLAYAAMTQFESSPAAGSTPGAEPRDDAAIVETVEPAPEEQPAEPAPAAVAPGRVLTALDATSAVRAVTSACPAPTVVESTSDSGATWAPVPADPVAAAQQLDWDGQAYLTVLGRAVEGCAPTFEQTWTSGADWDAVPEELAASWYLDPADRASVHTPEGARPGPCPGAVQVASSDAATAAVLCDDVTVHVTLDGGATWLSAGAIAGAGAIGAAPGGVFHAAIVGQGGCPGAQLVGLTVVDGVAQVGASGACLDAAVAAPDVAVGTAADGTTWMWAGDRVGRSADGGASWL